MLTPEREAEIRKDHAADYGFDFKVDDLLAEIDRLRELENKRLGFCKLGVGNGMGDLFVEGPYDAIKKVQSLIIQNELLRHALRKIADPRLRDHKEPDAYTELACVMHIANEALNAKCLK